MMEKVLIVCSECGLDHTDQLGLRCKCGCTTVRLCADDEVTLKDAKIGDFITASLLTWRWVPINGVIRSMNKKSIVIDRTRYLKDQIIIRVIK